METQNNGVFFAANCWENDWRRIISEGGYSRKIEGFKGYPFYKKILIINDVSDHSLVESEALILKNQNIIDEYYFSDSLANQVLSHFNVDRPSFGNGYYYSIGPMTAFYLSDAKFTLYLSSDVNVELGVDYNWVDSAIDILNNNEKVICANPVWNHNYEGARVDNVLYENDDWWFMLRFSDQIHLIKTDIFNKQIYNERSEVADRVFPSGEKYGDNLFEKRVYAFMQNNGYENITSKRISYLHPNI